MKGLTLIRPWPWGICHGGKDIENRGWRPRSVLGQRIAIHAGKGWDDSACDFMINVAALRGLATVKDNNLYRVRMVNHPAACVTGVATVIGWISDHVALGAREPRFSAYFAGGSAADTTLAGVLEQLHNLGIGDWRRSAAFFFGPIGWLLEDTRAVTPIPCGGARGLWEVPHDVVARIDEQLQSLAP